MVSDIVRLKSGSITCSDNKHVYIAKDNESIQMKIQINDKEKKNAKISKK